jgi:prepilin-type N-terminal cleavage/methylation domain-containing protein
LQSIQSLKLQISNSKVKGFTLLEVLLSLVLITILFSIAAPAYYGFFYRNDLDVAKNEVAQSLGRAAFLSSASDGDMNWGVKILSGNVIIFKGLSYGARDVNYDELYSIAGSIVPSGLNEIVFDKLTGLPQATGTIILTSASGEARTITINTKGSATY